MDWNSKWMKNNKWKYYPKYDSPRPATERCPIYDRRPAGPSGCSARLSGLRVLRSVARPGRPLCTLGRCISIAVN